MKTCNTNRIWVDGNFFDELAERISDQKIAEAEKLINDLYIKLSIEVRTLTSQWIKIEGKDVYYIHKFKILIPDLTSFRCSVVNENKFNNNFFGYTGRIINEAEAYDLFFINRNANIFFTDMIWFSSFDENHCVVRYSTRDNNEYECINTQGNRSCCYKNLYNNCHSCSWGYGVKIPVFDMNDCSAAENFIDFDLVPELLSPSGKTFLKACKSLKDAGYIAIGNDHIRFTETFRKDVMNGKINELFGIEFINENSDERIKKYTGDNVIELNSDFKDKYTQNLLCCDKIRANIEEYDIKRLTDPNLGMWELWENERQNSSRFQITSDLNLTARNPLADVRDDGIVGIDFGTKSTIVVYQNGSDTIMPMRIGIGQMSAQISPEQYENPTVMEIKNLEHFKEQYDMMPGRPETSWDDITISHTAHENMTSSTVSDNFYSYFYDLKQWCADSEGYHIATIKDQCGKEYELNPYMHDDNNIFDPIEYYAYYLGLFINNMRNGIFLEYLLSFPITYEKDLREKLLESFRRGIKKSLPRTVLEDKQCMDIFSVENGVNEPIAYAATAFTEFGLKPPENEEYIYGVFDFGGGTTDFSFGSFRRSNISEKKKYDYVISYSNYGGDRYLGGENLLELLAFNIFKANYRRLLKNEKYNFDGIEFSLHPECEVFLGSETLISNSQKAKRNTKQLVEKLRPYWENVEGGYTKAVKTEEDLSDFAKKSDIKKDRSIQQIENGFIKVDLFDNSGRLLEDFELDIVNEDIGIKLDLNQILQDRIEQGVRQFFSSLTETFSYQKIAQTKGIEIFLAGNSGKSPLLIKLIDKYRNMCSEASGYTVPADMFRIYPSLGTPDAAEIQKAHGIEASSGDMTGPNGKTGVAYGLLKCRAGSRIKVESKLEKEPESIFFFNLGHCEDELFICDIQGKKLSNKWTEFLPADENRVEVYYTSLPESISNKLNIAKAGKKILRLKETKDDAFIYIRTSSHTSLEYVIAQKENISSEMYLSEIMSLDF